MPQAKLIESVPPADAALPRAAEPAPAIPRYLQETYRWAYLSEGWRWVLDRPSVVSAILWGNANRLMDAAVAEFASGAHVLQTACVYGDFSPRLARRVGAGGRLEVIDVAPLQIANCHRKLSAYPQVRLRVVDASRHDGEGYDGVCCFFLLHEVPEDYKQRIVDRLLASVRPGGKVVFVDYHRPRRNHPLRPVMRAGHALRLPPPGALRPSALEPRDRELRRARGRLRVAQGDLLRRALPEDGGGPPRAVVHRVRQYTARRPRVARRASPAAARRR